MELDALTTEIPLHIILPFALMVSSIHTMALKYFSCPLKDISKVEQK